MHGSSMIMSVLLITQATLSTLPVTKPQVDQLVTKIVLPLALVIGKKVIGTPQDTMGRQLQNGMLDFKNYMTTKIPEILCMVL